MLAQKLILSYSSRIFIQFIRIAVTIVVARVAGPSVLGTVAFGLAYVNMFKFISDLGIGTAHIKLISEGYDEASCIGIYARLKIILLFLFVTVVVGSILIQKYFLNYSFESEVHEHVLWLCLAAISISDIFNIPRITFLAKMEQAKQDIPDFVRTILYQSMRLGVVLLGYKAVAIVTTNLISFILMIPVYVYLFKDYPIGKWDAKIARQYFKISIPLIIIAIVQTIVGFTDKVFLQYLTNSSEQVGYYTAGFRIGGFILLIGTAVGNIFFPLFSQAISDNKFSKINENTNKFQRFSLLFILPVVILISINSDLIVYFILGEQYEKSINVLSIITLALFIYTLFLPFGSIIIAKGYFKLAAKIHIIQGVIYLTLIYVLVAPSLLNMKGEGMAIALLISNLLLGMLFVINAKKIMKELELYKNIRLFIIVFATSVLYYISYLSFGISLKLKLLLAFLYAFILFGILFVTHTIAKEDLDMILNILNINKMKKYIKNEILNRNNK